MLTQTRKRKSNVSKTVEQEMDGDIDENIDILKMIQIYPMKKNVMLILNLNGMIILQCKKKIFKVATLVWFTFLMKREKKVSCLLERFWEDFVLKRIVEYNI